MSNYPPGETPSDALKEQGSNTVIVLSHDGQSSSKVDKWVSDFRGGARVEWVNSYQLPETPPGGATEVFMDSGIVPKFRDAEHKRN
jgi:hypothetical protein